MKQAQKSFRVVFDTQTTIKIRADPQSQKFPYRMTARGRKAGTYPQINVVGSVTSVQLLASIEGKGVEFPYPTSGTKPDRSFQASIEPGTLKMQIDSTNAEVLYRACGSKRKL